MDNKIKSTFFISTFLFVLVFALVGIYSYPQEDALILYRYALNLAESGEIVFNINDKPTEGATDFLWMVALSVLAIFKLDPFLSSLVISSLCFFAILKIFYENIYKENNLYFYILFVFLFLNTGQVIGSSLYGFSTLIFCSIGFLMYVYAFRGNFKIWSLFSIIFCLFRPEGLIFFLPSIFIAFQNVKSKNEFYNFSIYFTLVLISGLIYFYWRYLYFDNFLPLPLIIKQYGGELSITRFFATISQLTSTFFIALIIPIIIFLIKSKKEFYRLNNRYFSSFIIIIFSCLLYIFSLSTGYQSQNIFFRYFAPIYFIVFLISMYSLSTLIDKRYLFILCSIILIAGSIDNSNLLNRIFNIEDRKIYNPTTKIFSEFSEKSFAKHPIVAVANSLKGNKEVENIMVTEAGVLPLVTKFHTYDLVGLNTEMFAYNPVMCEDIKTIAPSFIEIDVGPLYKIFDLSKLYEDKQSPQCGIIGTELIYNNQLIIDENQQLEIKDYNFFKDDSVRHQNSPTYIAAQNILFCLRDNQEYTKLFINQKSDQLYFIRNDEDDLADSFLESCNYNAKGYFFGD